MKATVEVEARDGAARAGRVVTARGSFPSPAFMPVGTRGSVRSLGADDLDALAPPVVLANTYHLMLRPGADVVRELGGLAAFTGWDGHSLTDSGGYQIFSLAPKVDDDGALFRSTYDGSSHHLSPETAVAVQADIGADIQMVLDVCPGLPAPDRVVRAAAERTARWAERGRAAFLAAEATSAERGLVQAQFGIVQGGIDPALRAASARWTTDVGFDGYGIGGLSVGESRAEMLPALAAALAGLPEDQPRYLMGVGDPASLVEAIALGVDMFDCVLPTRLARHGTLLTDAGRFNVKRVANARDPGPVDETCPCPTCARYSRGYLRHLMQVGELSAYRLLTIHNVSWLLRFVARTTDAIREQRLDAWRAEVLTVWG
ncbi:tRNA guanosine(34) transglycosylase Tgt [Iamia sp. SCSIO 61187]|uniref:tRNA guanosine(34) transglycosylase Tgt n=1 Tax=Iamia sp. SCSIO 61187 TaxID=2722752 RepID=UPI001C62B167|nr:tRNA guanosine(34) transglycosylase Tgt [Iamia sp. SCSIO 61187]QYG93395.1 tRNA guanosine(34) transglycosylase Tgt [Iamia sp. SCSIO 61187]